MSRRLYVPRGYERTVLTCSTCDRTWPRSEMADWQKHVGECYRKHEAEVLAVREAEKQRMAIFHENAWDPELSAYLRKVGDRMLEEGRLEMKPNERSHD